MRCVVCWWGDMRPKYRAQRHAHRARVEKRSAPGSFGNSRRLTGRGSKRTVFGIGTGIADAAAAESNACAPAAGQQRALGVLTQYRSVSRLAERGRPEDGKEGEGMLSVIGAEHGAASEAECGAGEVANGGRERGKSGVRWRFQADL